MAVVTSPVIGKVAKVSFERFLGTIAGELADHTLLTPPSTLLYAYATDQQCSRVFILKQCQQCSAQFAPSCCKQPRYTFLDARLTQRIYSAPGINHHHPFQPTATATISLPFKQHNHLRLCVTQTILSHKVCACTGGVLAYGAARFGRDVIPLADEVVCTVATLLAASGAQLVGQRAGSAYAAKLSTITFLLVLLGSKDTPSELERTVISRWRFFL